MDTKTWTIREITHRRASAERLLRVVHSRCEALRKACQDFEKKEVVKLLVEVKKQVRAAQEGLRRIPANIGEAVLKPGKIKLVKQEVLPGMET